MDDRLEGFSARIATVQDQEQLLELECDIREFFTSIYYKNLGSEDRDLLDDIMVEIVNKKEYLKRGCDPMRFILENNPR